jgi:hypothetical protein
MKLHKEYLKRFLMLGIATASLTSCATVFDGHITESQKRRPAKGEPRRDVKIGALIADILLFPLVSLPVDFATGAIYKATPKPQVQEAEALSSPTVAKKNK